MPQARVLQTRAQQTHNESNMNTPMSMKGQKKVGVVMHEFKKGKLHSGSGKIVKNRRQAIAIGLSEARKKGK